MAIQLKPINIKKIRFTIEGVTPLIQHRFDSEAQMEISAKEGGKKTKNRTARDKKAEMERATHRTEKGEYALPVKAIKGALINAAHKDIGIEKTLVKKAIFFGFAELVPLKCSKPIMRSDYVRVPPKTGNATIRYRPEFKKWSAKLEAEIDGDLLRTEDIVNLIERAGFGVGVGQWRPEKGGEYGRFKIGSDVEEL